MVRHASLPNTEPLTGHECVIQIYAYGFLTSTKLVNWEIAGRTCEWRYNGSCLRVAKPPSNDGVSPQLWRTRSPPLGSHDSGFWACGGPCGSNAGLPALRTLSATGPAQSGKLSHSSE